MEDITDDEDLDKKCESAMEDDISVEETEITGDIVFLLPEKFTHCEMEVLQRI